MFASGPCPARPERARCNGLGESRRLALAAAGADNAQALMLGHPHGHHRQFLDLTARRRTDRDPVGHTEPMPAGAVSRPVLDDLVDRPRRQQRAALALMPWLSALLAPRRVLAAPWRRAGRIGAGRLRQVPRRALGLALELRDPLLLTRDPRRQLLDLRLSRSFCVDSANKTSTAASRPWPQIGSASARSTARDSTGPGYVPQPN